jgi:hypothetical protein
MTKHHQHPAKAKTAPAKKMHINNEYRHPATSIPDTSVPEYEEVIPGLDHVPEGDNAKG